MGANHLIKLLNIIEMKTQKFKQTEIGKIPEDWEVKTTEELVSDKKGSIKIGPFGSQLKKEYLVSKGYKLYGQENIYKKNFSLGNRYINEERFNLLSSCELKPGDLIVSMMGTIGFVIIVPENIEKGIMDSHLLRIRIDNNIVDNNFLKHAFRSKIIQFQIDSLSVGTIMAGLSSKVIKELIFPYPPISEQTAIAKILSSLDEKIELNNKMNKTLEAIGQAIFKKWFVDEKEEIWEEGFFNDKILTELIKPGIDKFEGEKIYLPTANISNSSITNYDYKITFEERPSRASMQPRANTIWFAKMKDSPKIQLFLEGEDWRLNNLILSTGFAGIKPKREALFYIWNIIKNPSFEIEKDNLAMGTTMQAINNENIKRIKYAIPSEEILTKFNKLVQPIFKQISINCLQNQTLSQIRDVLLPKLMSGEVRVK